MATSSTGQSNLETDLEVCCADVLEEVERGIELIYVVLATCEVKMVLISLCNWLWLSNSISQKVRIYFILYLPYERLSFLNRRILLAGEREDHCIQLMNTKSYFTLNMASPLLNLQNQLGVLREQSNDKCMSIILEQERYTLRLEMLT